MDKVNSIIVLGGGTSGLITALILKRRFKNTPIKVIESSSIGVIGVGEGATEHWRYFCEVADIKLEDTLVNCGATLKSAIKFSNWGVPDYYHATCEPYCRSANDYMPVYAKIIAEGGSPLDMVQKNVIENTVPEAWVNGQGTCPTNQFHFNTFTAGTYLKTVCQDKGIDIVDDKIIDVVINDNGYVTSLVGEKETHYADFFVDSSGFAKVIIKKLGANWTSYKDNLWVNSAIAFPTEDTDEYPIYTGATGMDYGWMWNTPVMGRWGNGYVFCDKYINFEQAQAEVEKKLGRKVEIAKKIKFDDDVLEKIQNKKENTLNTPLGEFREKNKHLHRSSLNAHIRVLARSWFKDLTKLPCACCGYDKHVELCHIKSLSSFGDDSLISEANHKDNIVQLCPNCHWEFDNGFEKKW
jgi:tryptophan halogenase